MAGDSPDSHNDDDVSTDQSGADETNSSNTGSTNANHQFGASDHADALDHTGNSQQPLNTDPAGQGQRATGGASDSTLADRATGDQNHSELLAARSEDPLGLFSDAKNSPTYHLLDEDPAKALGDSLAAVQSGERTMDWVGRDLEALEGGLKSLRDGIADFFAGIGDFVANYHEMIAVNTKGADKFFHCQANCQAAARGTGGLLAAKTISYGREATDLVKNEVKGMSWRDNLDDCRSDLAADRAGWDAGSRGLRCNDACNGYRPRGM